MKGLKARVIFVGGVFCLPLLASGAETYDLEWFCPVSEKLENTVPIEKKFNLPVSKNGTINTKPLQDFIESLFQASKKEKFPIKACVENFLVQDRMIRFWERNPGETGNRFDPKLAQWLRKKYAATHDGFSEFDSPGSKNDSLSPVVLKRLKVSGKFTNGECRPSMELPAYPSQGSFINYPTSDDLWIHESFLNEKLYEIEKEAQTHPDLNHCRGKFIYKSLERLTHAVDRCRDTNANAEKECVALLKRVPAILAATRKLAERLAKEEDSIPPAFESKFQPGKCVTPADRNKAYYDIYQFREELRHWSKCVSLKPGETHPVHFGKNDGLTGAGGNYVLKRVDAQNFKISIPVAFTPESMKSKILPRAQACLKNVSPSLKGPSGEHIELNLDDSGQSPLRPNEIAVYDLKKCEALQEKLKAAISKSPNLSDATLASLYQESEKLIGIRVTEGTQCSRSNSLQWAESKLNCAVIAHEIMHLLGLSDEYPEKKKGVSNSEFDLLENDCRITGPEASLMHGHEEAFKRSGLNPVDGSRASGTTHSLLSRRQINAILYPGCASKNEDFYRCSQFAYQSSWEIDKTSGSQKVIRKSCGDPKVIDHCKKVMSEP